jgi:catechol-2,3-dioxygenase
MDTIHHIAIQVNNIQESIAWYTEHYDVSILYEDESWCLIQFSNVALALVLASQQPPHFAVLSDKPEKYGSLTFHHDGTTSLYIQDPSGNHIEMIKVDSET